MRASAAAKQLVRAIALAPTLGTVLSAGLTTLAGGTCPEPGLDADTQADEECAPACRAVPLSKERGKKQQAGDNVVHSAA